MKYDVVVVGGRIGGSISSLFASRNDLDVLMIEKGRKSEVLYNVRKEPISQLLKP